MKKQADNPLAKAVKEVIEGLMKALSNFDYLENQYKAHALPAMQEAQEFLDKINMSDAEKIKAWDLMYGQHSESFFKNDDHYPESAWEVINLMDTYANTAKLILENNSQETP